MFLVLESIVHCSKYAVVRGENLGLGSLLTSFPLHRECYNLSTLEWNNFDGMIEPSRHDVVESHDDARKAWILERGEQSLL